MTRHDMNFHLLYAVLAMQNKFVSRDQLIDALNHWAIDKSRPLDEILHEKHAIESDDQQMLKRLADRQLEIHGDFEESLVQITGTFDLIDNCGLIKDDELRGQLQSLIEHASASGLQGSSAATADTFDFKANQEANQEAKQEPPLNLNFPTGPHKDRFTIVASHAKGGLGEVFIAKDNDLDRDVALKEIQGKFARDSTARYRFEFEACVTGGLEHPGIVPVYAYGYYRDGRPYYTMRFIRGRSMKEEIEEYHKRLTDPSASDDQRRSALRGLLARFVDTCNAIAYAHSRGVLHRDIKPANVMLGKFGETLVVDWGLAKSIGRDDYYSQASDEATLIPLSGNSNGSATMEGSTLGTPSFMSPEQANGKLDEMGPASDIFSLGATLYNILTGAAPFAAKTVREIVAKAAKNDFTEPIQVLPSIPRPLNAMVLKAMATSPGNRYHTALKLAADVEAFLSEDPVSAYRETALERASRWLKRHRTLATAGMVLVTTLGLGSAVGAVLIHAQKNRAVIAEKEAVSANEKTTEALAALQVETQNKEAALNREKQAHVTAVSARRQTSELFNLVTTDVIGEMLARQEKLTEADNHYFNDLLKLCEEFSNPGKSAEGKNLHAEGLLRVGNLQRLLGKNEDAKASYEKAIDLWSHLLEESPEDPNYAQELASALAGLAATLEPTQHERAVELYASADEMLSKVLQPIEPSDVDPSNRIALDSATIEKVKLERAGVQGNLGLYLTRLKRSEEAEQRFLQSQKAYDELAKSGVTSATAQNYARVLGNYAGLMTGNPERWPEARGYLEQAITILSQTSTDHAELPRRPKQSLATYSKNLGKLLSLQKEPDQAIERYWESVDLFKQLVEEFPSLRLYRSELFAAQSELANLYRNDLKDYDSAISLYEALLDSVDRFGNPNEDPLYSRKLKIALFGLADSLSKAKNYASAAPLFERLSSNRQDPNWQAFELQRALCLIRTGQTEQGIEAALAIALDPKVPPVLLFDTACCYAVAAEMHPEDESKVDAYREQAMDYLGQAVEAGHFENVKMREHLAGDSDLNSLKGYPPFVEFCKNHQIPLE